MKKSILLFAILFSFSGLSAQWSSVYHDPAKIFVDASFPTPQDGFVLGRYNSGNSFILRTTDGGATWTELALPYQNLQRISMRTTQIGYVAKAGTPGRILKTTNGFATIIPHLLDSAYSIMGLEALTDSSGFYLNNGGRLRSFDHNGATYAYEMDTLINSNSMSFPSQLTGYADNGMVLDKTIDGGNSWFCVNGNMGIFSLGISFCAADTGYCMVDYNGGIWKTTDGGATFQNIHVFQGMHLVAKGHYCAAIDYTGNACWTSDDGMTWHTEGVGLNYTDLVFLAPGGDCYVISTSSGDIVKRSLLLSVPMEKMESNISVYPNPTSDQLHISLPSNFENKNCSVSLVNSLGEIVFEEKMNESGEISLGEFAAGIYCVRISVNGVVVESKLISKR